MLRRFMLIPAIFALAFWAWTPNAALAGDGHRGHGKDRGYQNNHNKGGFERGGHRNDRRRDFRHHRERPRHARRHSGRRHHHRGFQNYVFDHGYCRTAYKLTNHGIRCRSRDYYPRRSGGYDRHGAVYTAQPRYVARTLEKAADGQSIIWNDSRKQARYEIVPTQTYRTDNGRYCREYLNTATVGGQTRQVFGQACRQEDGTWEIVR